MFLSQYGTEKRLLTDKNQQDLKGKRLLSDRATRAAITTDVYTVHQVNSMCRGDRDANAPQKRPGKKSCAQNRSKVHEREPE